MKAGAERFDSGSMKDRIVRSIWALGDIATKSKLRKAIDCVSDTIFDMQLEGLQRRGEIYIAAGGHFALRGELADTMLELYPPSSPAPVEVPPPAAAQDRPTIDPPSTQESDNMAKKRCKACQQLKDESEFWTGQGKCKPCHTQRQKDRKAKAGGDAPTPAIPAAPKVAAPKKRAAAVGESPVVDEYVIHASGALKCKAQGTNGGRQYLLEQDGALIVCDPAQLLELIGWGRLQLEKAP